MSEQSAAGREAAIVRHRGVDDPEVGRKVTWQGVPDIAPSARRHGIADDDMRHALRNPIGVDYLDEGLTMFTGPRPDGSLLEIGVVDSDHGPVIVHADRARPKYLPGGR
jgi:hypothetical protein